MEKQKNHVKPLCFANLMRKQTICLVIRANVSRIQNRSRENHLEFAGTIFSRDVNRIMALQSAWQPPIYAN